MEEESFAEYVTQKILNENIELLECLKECCQSLLHHGSADNPILIQAEKLIKKIENGVT